MALAGSLSEPLATTIARRRRLATARSFSAVRRGRRRGRAGRCAPRVEQLRRRRARRRQRAMDAQCRRASAARPWRRAAAGGASARRSSARLLGAGRSGHRAAPRRSGAGGAAAPSAPRFEVRRATTRLPLSATTRPRYRSRLPARAQGDAARRPSPGRRRATAGRRAQVESAGRPRDVDRARRCRPRRAVGRPTGLSRVPSPVPRTEREGRRARPPRRAWACADAAAGSTGVPARGAQPSAERPCGRRPRRRRRGRATSPEPAPRIPARAGQSRRSRPPSATTTAPTHTAVSDLQPDRARVGAGPRPWSTATGQHGYAAQCTARQARRPRRARSRLVTMRASSRSKASAPKPSHRGR